MIEINLLNLIKKTLSQSGYIGDDCACLEEFGLSVTQDNLVEGVHFDLDKTSAYLLGYKSVAVNFSDIAAAGAEPLYVFVGLSMPANLGEKFVKEFYGGINDICTKYNAQVAGGDITSAQKLFISITVIGKNVSKFVCSRKNAKTGDYVVVTGVHGSSACGLKLLQNDLKEPEEIILKHTKPEPRVFPGTQIARSAQRDFALMDSSDGLGDALYKISHDSQKTLLIDFSKIPFDPQIVSFAEKFNADYKNWILWGGEDYELVGCIDKNLYEKMNSSDFTVIGKVIEKQPDADVFIKIGEDVINIDRKTFDEKSYNHFE